MSKNTTMYIDLTMLAHWPGHLTGIPRVMYELAQGYVDDGTVHFMIWGEDQGKYFLVKKAETLRDHGKQIHYIRSDGNTQQTSKEKVFEFATKAINKVERSTTQFVPGVIKSKLAEEAVDAQEASPVKGDLIFMPWGAQGPDNLIEYLRAATGNGIKLSQFFHDLLPVSAPQFSGHSKETMEKYIRQTFELTDLVVANSQSTKNDLQKWMKNEGLSVPETLVVRLGDSFDEHKPQKPTDDVFMASGLTGGDYIICVGTVEARKNHMLLYYVYKLAKSRGIDLPPVVIVGRQGWHTENVLDLMNNDPEVKHKFVVLHNASDEELAWLYKNAKFGVQPSFYEGWGIPVAECIFFGKPCVASSESSIPEIAGDMVDYFNPASSEECLAAIQSYLDDKKLAEATKRIKKYKVTKWSDTFKQVDKGLRDVTS